MKKSISLLIIHLLTASLFIAQTPHKVYCDRPFYDDFGIYRAILDNGKKLH